MKAKTMNKNKLPQEARVVEVNNSRCKITGKLQSEIIGEQLNKTGKDYYYSITNYTDVIETTDGIKYVISNDSVNRACFAATNKIKSDIKKKGYVIDEIPRDAIKYYSMPEKNMYFENAMLIDINAAYPNVLKKYEIISEETFDYLMNIDKIDRLRAIGALATNKIKLKINSGKILEHEIINDKELSQFYFLCCYEIGIVLEKCEQAAKDAFKHSINPMENSFLFSWFDGIYIKYDHVTKSKIFEVIENAGYEFKIIKLDFFKSELKNEKIFISWKEENKDVKRLVLQNKPLNEFKKWKSQLKNLNQAEN